MAKRQPTEASEQKSYISWFYLQHVNEIIHSIPNHLVRSKAQAAREIELGLLPGCPDLFIPAPRGRHHGLYIEMKRKGGGIVASAQKDVIMRLNHRGYCALVCKGFGEAMEATQAYMNIPLSR